LKVLLIHNYYQQSGGEDQVVQNEIDMLRNKGHIVELFKMSNDKLNNLNILEKMGLFINTIWSVSSYKSVLNKINTFNPDIVHFHNFFPLISPSAYYACKKKGKAVVQTLHNYRLVCPAATFLRDGNICEKCLEEGLGNAIKYKCYRNSSTQTATIVSMLQLNKSFKTWTNKVDKYICLTNFAKEKMSEGGIPKDKIIVKPNFIESKHQLNLNRENYILFVGRISEEKGLEVLLSSWMKLTNKRDMKLIIIGDGPEKNILEEKYKDDTVVFKGKKSSEEVLSYMKRAKFLVMPSIWYEGFPMTIVEAYSVGTPVIASNIGSLKEIVKDDVSGYQFINRDIEDLTDVLDKAINNKNIDRLIINSHHEYKTKYSKEINYNFLSNIYTNLIGDKCE